MTYFSLAFLFAQNFKNRRSSDALFVVFVLSPSPPLWYLSYPTFLNTYPLPSFNTAHNNQTKESSMSKPKTVYFIRHAESEENRRLASLKTCVQSLQGFQLPTTAHIQSSLELLNVSAQIDSDVSDIGIQQIQDLARQVKETNFLQQHNIELVVHSPLIRATQTCFQGLLLDHSTNESNSKGFRILEVDLLMEKTPREWVDSGNFRQRMINFQQWLTEQPESTICIVGHSQYFKAMLQLDFKFDNCDIWKATFHSDKFVTDNGNSKTKETKVWSDLERVLECRVKRSNHTESTDDNAKKPENG